MRKLMSVCITIFFLSGLWAQDSLQHHTLFGSVMGNVLDQESGKSLAECSVRLTATKDSVAAKTVITDKIGNFLFPRLRPGLYKISISYMGYNTLVIDSICINKEKSDINMEDLRLHKGAAVLNEVIVYAGKPLIENKDDKIIYNVGESPLSNGSNASELLKNMPMVNTNPDGSILLRGKAPLILMDEKPTNLNTQQLSDLLESLPASVIEKVEIMLNPPPEYATYDGGVINIVTKKGRVGIYGKATVSGGTKGEGSLSTNFSYRTSQLNLNANAGCSYVQATGNSYSHRENFYADSVNYFYTKGTYNNHNRRPNMRLQADYDFNKQSNLSVVYQGNLNYFNNNSTTLYSNLDSLLEVYKASTRLNHNKGDGYSHGLSFNYQWKGPNPVEKLQVMGGYNIGKNDNSRSFYQAFLQPDFLPTGLDSSQAQLTDIYTQSGYLRVNYNKPLNDTGTVVFTTGASFSGTSNHNILNTNFLHKPDSIYINNELLSNNFFFHQNIITARAGLIIMLPEKWRLITGVQAEQTSMDFKFINGRAPNTNNGYWRLLPNITIRKNFDMFMSLTAVFRETIRRPGITELNPSIDYSDPYNIRFGNPYIQPSLTDNYDLNFSYVQSKFNCNASVGYNKAKNVFNSIKTLTDSGKTQVTYQNISDQDEFLASFWSGYTISRSLRVNVSSGYNYNRYSQLEKQLYKYKNGGTFYIGFNYSFSPDRNITTLEGTNRYSSFASPQGRTRSNISMTLGIQRKFLNKRLIVGLTAIDPLGLQKYRAYTTGTNFVIESYSSGNTRNFRLTISYQLNKTMLKSNLNSRQKKESLDKLQLK